MTPNAANLSVAMERPDDFDQFVADQIRLDIDLSISQLAQRYRNGRPLCEIMKRHRPQPNHASLTGALYGLQKEIGAHFESPLARDFMFLLDFDRNVESFTPKPLKISYTFGGRARVYEPAVLVHHLGADPIRPPRLCGIHTQRALHLSRLENKARFSATDAECAKRGWIFEILSEKEIRTPYLSNAKFLLPFRRYDTFEPEHMLLRDAIPIGRKTTPSQLMETAFSRMKSDRTLSASLHPDSDTRRGRMLAMIWKVVADGFLVADFSAGRITEETEVWSPFGLQTHTTQNP